jgi:hypothetical protein
MPMMHVRPLESNMLTLSIGELLDKFREKVDLEGEYEFVYVDPDQWLKDPLRTPLYLYSFEESEEFDDRQGLPTVVVQRGLRGLLSMADIDGVAINLLRSVTDPTAADFADAVNHYREFDAFKYP